MAAIKNYLKNTCKLSNYQIAQLGFLAKTMLSEISKLILMGLLFYRHLSAFFFALFIMLFLRSSTGGLHFYTYISCLLTSILYLWLAIIALPKLYLSSYIKNLLLLAAILICYFVGPVVSKYRPLPSPQHFRRCRNISCCFMFLFSLLLYIMPDNPYMITGFWIIILHSLQLFAAKIRMKGENTE